MLKVLKNIKVMQMKLQAVIIRLGFESMHLTPLSLSSHDPNRLLGAERLLIYLKSYQRGIRKKPSSVHGQIAISCVTNGVIILSRFINI